MIKHDDREQPAAGVPEFVSTGPVAGRHIVAVTQPDGGTWTWAEEAPSAFAAVIQLGERMASGMRPRGACVPPGPSPDQEHIAGDHEVLRRIWALAAGWDRTAALLDDAPGRAMAACAADLRAAFREQS